ncbi:MAG: lysine-sensitive aspartokinase 3 [Bryobacterales bacterium]|nr:lysine-sensitive aspartokinase 3 [Bryobacterales bacterium]
MIVMKFGGSSVESAAAIARVVSIVEARLERRPVVVVSAMGKTTNRLLECAGLAAGGARAEALAKLAALREFHFAEAPAPVLGQLGAHFDELAEMLRGLSVLGEMTPRSVDAISAFGERMSSLVVAAAFRERGIAVEHVDARELIVTDGRHTQAAPLYAETYERLAARLPGLAARGVVVMGGFIGSTKDGVTSTLGRGGSDFSAAIAGAGIGAEEIQIWTDVDGMLTCDPRVLPGGRRVRVISFAEAAELAYFGAKVLHPSTVLPAVEKQIPVLILNSRRPEVEGTRIVARGVESANPIKSIACNRGITAVNIKSTRMLMAHGFLRRIFEVFDRHETAVDMVTTSEVSVSLTVDSAARLGRIVEELQAFAEVVVETDRALVALVGDGLGERKGIAGRAFQALNGVNVWMISQGASQLNLSFVIAGGDVEKAVGLLHAEFFTELDPKVFDVAVSEASV